MWYQMLPYVKRGVVNLFIYRTLQQPITKNQQLTITYLTMTISLFGIVVSTPDCHPRDPGFDFRLYPRNFSEVQGLERGPPSLVRPIGQLVDMRSSETRLRKLKLRLRDNALLTTRPPVLPSGSNHFSRSWLFGAVAPRIYYLFIIVILP